MVTALDDPSEGCPNQKELLSCRAAGSIAERACESVATLDGLEAASGVGQRADQSATHTRLLQKRATLVLASETGVESSTSTR